MRHLQWGIGVIALAYADGNHFGWVPFLVFGRLFKALFFPFFRWQYAFAFIGQVYACDLAQIELF